MDKDQFTNERIRASFDSQFALVNHAIVLAKEMIASGKEFTNPAEGLNPVAHILRRVVDGDAWSEDEASEEEEAGAEDEGSNSDESV